MNTDKPDMFCVTTADGKYTVRQDASGRLTALRHGEQWRDCVGDNLILALAHEVEGLRAENKMLTETINRYESLWADEHV